MSLLKQELISCEQELISQRNLSQDLQHKKELLEMDLREQVSISITYVVYSTIQSLIE